LAPASIAKGTPNRAESTRKTLPNGTLSKFIGNAAPSGAGATGESADRAFGPGLAAAGAGATALAAAAAKKNEANIRAGRDMGNAVLFFIRPIIAAFSPRTIARSQTMLVPFQTPFGVTHPLGLPRPIDVENVFGAHRAYFVHNLMPVPSGCLAHFDSSVYRPYMKRLASWLAASELGWSGSAEIGDPARYCLLRDGAPATVPCDLRDELPAPPVVRLESVLRYFDRHHAKAPGFQLFDLLTLVAEDLGASRFASATFGRTWVTAYIR
jgi:hypothetical protein